jgi:hypothetical protein
MPANTGEAKQENHMSAFLCNDDHFEALAAFAVGGNQHHGFRVPFGQLRFFGGRDMSGRSQRETATYFAALLRYENERSVAFRYGEEAPATYLGEDGAETANIRAARNLQPIDILKMCDCLEYQSCETDNYFTTAAWNLLQFIRRAAIRELPGYDGAVREYVKPEHLEAA